MDEQRRARRWPIVTLLVVIAVMTVLLGTIGWACVSMLAGFNDVLASPGSPHSPQDDFFIYRLSREVVVQQVLAGQIKVGDDNMNGGCLVSLGPDEPFVSWDGNEIIVADIDGKTCVFFYTSRSLGEYVGFLWAPTGTDPRQFRDLTRPGGQVERYDEHWYWVCGP